MRYRFAPFFKSKHFLSPLTGIETHNQVLPSILPDAIETFGVTKHDPYSFVLRKLKAVMNGK